MTVFKSLSADDRVSTKTLLHEAIPITGTILSGTYNNSPSDSEFNIQNFTHGMFQSVYDYPFLSSSANHIFDISFGTADTSPLVVTNQIAKKDNVYNQMAQVLMGYDKDGNIQKFDEDGNIAAGGAKITEAIFMPFSRLLVKDEIKKGSFSMSVGVAAAHAVNGTQFNKSLSISDVDGATSFKVNSPAGEYGILYATSSHPIPGAPTLDTTSTHKETLSDGNVYWRAGLIYYQAGVVVLTSSMFMATTDGGYLDGTSANTCTFVPSGQAKTAANTSLTGSLISEEISGSADALRQRISNIQFNNTIELNSTVYFCRAKHNEFNYSSNPTYLSGSQIRVKNETTDIPISYITSIGLYSADNQLLAVGKFSEPIRKDNNIELTFRARLDY